MAEANSTQTTGGIGGGSELMQLRQELERAKLLYNDLARENEVLREAGHITPELLKRYCDQARAYGWEAGRLFGWSRASETFDGLESMYKSHPQNPFINPDWDEDLKLPQGFMLSFKDVPL